MITVVCVKTGHKYGMRYVVHLKRMIDKYLPVEHRFVCLTDQHEREPGGIEFIDIREYGLKGWYAKMLIFNRSIVGPGKILFIDLDMVIARSLMPLVALDHEFVICRNFTQLRQMRDGGKVTWPCLYGSCVMLLGDGFGLDIWHQFMSDSWGWITRAKQMGDQWIIEQLDNSAVFFQDVLPTGYLLHYKDFTDTPDDRAAILVFAGKTKPIDCKIEWIKRLWYCPDDHHGG